jgi:hypothetical protein
MRYKESYGDKQRQDQKRKKEEVRNESIPAEAPQIPVTEEPKKPVKRSRKEKSAA